MRRGRGVHRAFITAASILSGSLGYMDSNRTEELSMTESQPESGPSLADVAAEPAEESASRERELLGNETDTASVVAPDDAQ